MEKCRFSRDSKAFLLLIEEIGKHLESTKTLLMGGRGELTPEIIRQIGIEFHTVKGGAGFFGLETLAAAAAGIERVLLKEQITDIERIIRAKKLFPEFERLAREVIAQK